MPIYTYINDKTQEIREVFQNMQDKHVFFDENGVEWRRNWEASLPQASFDTKGDPFSENAFIEKTGKNKGSVGDLWDRSAEMSRKRAQITGSTDPVMDKYYKNATLKRKGKKSFHQLQKEAGNVGGLI